jgi:hypothetical protein
MILPKKKPVNFKGTDEEWKDWRDLSEEERMQREADDSSLPSKTIDADSLAVFPKCDVYDEKQIKRIREAAWSDLTLYELWQVRLADMFDEDEIRNYRHNTAFDSKVFKAVRMMRRDLESIQLEPVFLYVVTSFGISRIREKYIPLASEITRLINDMDDDPYFIGNVEQTGKLRITPGAGVDNNKMGFTYADSAAIQGDAKYFGVEDKSFLTIAFWVGALAHKDLPDDLWAHGTVIVDQFERHLNMRLKNLKSLHESYSLTS